MGADPFNMGGRVDQGPEDLFHGVPGRRQAVPESELTYLPARSRSIFWPVYFAIIAAALTLGLLTVLGGGYLLDQATSGDKVTQPTPASTADLDLLLEDCSP